MRWTAVLVACAAMVLLPAIAEASVTLTWSPQTSGTFDFGAVAVGQSLGRTFQLRNDVTRRTPRLAIRVNGSTAFRKMRDTCSGKALAPGAGCLVRVSYTPAAAGQADTASMDARRRDSPATSYAAITLTGRGESTAESLCDSYGGTYATGVALVFSCSGWTAASLDDAVATDAAFSSLCTGTDTQTYVGGVLVVSDGQVQPNSVQFPSSDTAFACVNVP